MKNSLLLFLILFSLSVQAQRLIYVSDRQGVFDLKKVDRLNHQGKRMIILADNQFRIELPDTTDLSGTLTFEKDFTNDKGERYIHFQLDNGGILVLGDQNLTLALTETHKKIFTFYIDKALTGDKKEFTEAARMRQFKHQVQSTTINALKKNYDEFTQKCLDDRKVRIGMDGKAVHLLLDDKIRVQTTETASGTTEIQTYKNYIIHVTNGKVDAISKIE